MFQVGSDWNPKQTLLKELVLKPDKFEEAIETCLSLHSIVHCMDISQKKAPTFQDDIWENLTIDAFVTIPTAKDVTIAWNTWHITRIEDITSNILIQDAEQVLNDEWLSRLKTDVRDTGNAMSDDEIVSLSKSLDMSELRNYRNAVGARTREILKNLCVDDMKRKVSQEGLARVLSEGGVTEHKDSAWLLDFWGKKTIAGILLMPITRHQVVHLNDSVRLKKKLTK